MIQSELAQHLVALLVVAMAVVLQNAATSQVGTVTVSPDVMCSGTPHEQGPRMSAAHRELAGRTRLAHPAR
jgi:hypothetical protein